MNISKTSVPTSPAPSRWTPTRKLLVGAVGGGMLIAAGFWAEGSRDQTPTSANRAATGLKTTASTLQPVIGGAADGWVRTVYLAGSEEQAATMRVNINEADSVRYQQGLSPVLEDVLVAVSQAEADHLSASIYEGNMILAAFGREYRVVDLRPL